VTRNRVLRYAAIGGGLALVLGVAVAAFVSLRVPFDISPSAGPSTGPCEPQPCANVRGYILWVSDLKTDGRLVRMQLRFQNSSSSTHADPTDISLSYGQNAGTAPIYDAPGCTPWPRTEFNNGASFGPVPECFRLFSTAPPLSLHWTPDFGPFCCEVEIPLE
jgi:hypothetical protein